MLETISPLRGSRISILVDCLYGLGGKLQSLKIQQISTKQNSDLMKYSDLAPESGQK